MADEASQHEWNMLSAIQQTTAASLAAALIVSAKRPHSVAQALDVFKSVSFALYPRYGLDEYEKWKREGGIDKVHE